MVHPTTRGQALGLLLALLGGAGRAAASPAPPAAREHHNRALHLVQRGDHRAAIHEFLSAYRLYATPNLLFNVAVAYDTLSANGALEDLSEARRFYLRYLEERPSAPDRDDVEGRIRRLDRQLERRQPKAPPPLPIAPPPTPAQIAPPTAAAPPPSAPVAALAPATTAPPPRRRWPLALALSGAAAVAVGAAAVGIAFALPSDAPVPMSDFGVANVRF